MLLHCSSARVTRSICTCPYGFLPEFKYYSLKPIFTTEFLIQEYSIGIFIHIYAAPDTSPEVTWIVIFMLPPLKKDVDNIKREKVVFLFSVIR